MIKLIALFGKSASGKDLIQNILADWKPEKYHKIISCTTRPPREKEIEGKDYFFITEEEFAGLAYEDQLIEATEFNGWFYGTARSSLDKDKINIGIFTPDAIEILLSTAHDYDLKILPIYIACDDLKRIHRSLEREAYTDLKEIARRFLTDEEDFKDEHLNFFYLLVYNDLEPIEQSDIIDTINNVSKDFFG